MLNTVLASFYERDLRKLIKEINLFKNDENLWKTTGSDQEFIKKGVERKELVIELEKLIRMINETVNAFTQEQMDAEYPIMFDDMKVSNNYVLTQLLLHLNYHLGQINYLRRILE